MKLISRKRFNATSLVLLLVIAGCGDETVPLPREMTSLPFGRMHDVRLNMKRTELEKQHRLTAKENYWLENLDGYPVEYDFNDGRLQSVLTRQEDPTEGLSQMRYRQLVLEAFRQTGVQPVCSIDPATSRVAARFALKDAVYVVVHDPEVSTDGRITSPARVTRWFTRDADPVLRGMSPQKCVR